MCYRQSGSCLYQCPVGALVSGADECCPFGVWDYFGKSYLWGEVCDSVSLVFTEELVAGPAAPDIYRSDNVAVVYEVYNAIVDDIVLVSLQDPRSEGSALDGVRKGLAFTRRLFRDTNFLLP